MRLALLLLVGAAAGCAGSPPPVGSGPATAPAVAPAELQAITFVRTRDFHGDSLKLAVSPAGEYRLSRRGGGGASSSTIGTLTPAERNAWAAAFAGWADLEPLYLPPLGVREDYRFDVRYGEKAVNFGSAAVKDLASLKAVYELVQGLVRRAGIL